MINSHTTNKFLRKTVTTITLVTLVLSYFYTPLPVWLRNNLPEPAKSIVKAPLINEALAVSCPSGYTAVKGDTECRKFLIAGASFDVPSDWNSASNTIECIGAGRFLSGLV